MKNILFFILLVILLVIFFTYYKIQTVKIKQEKEVITINSIWEKEGKPVNILNIKNYDFITYFKVSCSVLKGIELICEVPLSIKNKVKLNSNFISDNKISGKVTRISNTANIDNSLYKIYLKSDSHIENEILPLYIEDKIFKNSIKIPKTVLVEKNNISYVWILDSTNKVRLKKISYSLTNEFNEVLVRDGLKVGDRIVVLGKELLKEYDFVKVHLEY